MPVPRAPRARQEAYTERGTAGGGFRHANSALPFANPNGGTNIGEFWSFPLIPVASALAFGRSIGDPKQGRAILSAMAAQFVAGVAVI